MEMVRCDDNIFEKFDQIYLTFAYPGVVKGWHYHKKQTHIFIPVKGMFKLVLYDNCSELSAHEETNEFFIAERNPLVVTIPTAVCIALKA